MVHSKCERDLDGLGDANGAISCKMDGWIESILG